MAAVPGNSRVRTCAAAQLGNTYTDSGGEIMKNLSAKRHKKDVASGVAPFSDARKAVIDEMITRTPVIKVPSRLRLIK
jgi:hypothetical protein